MKKILSASLTILICLNLTACGFHLRSAQDLPPQLHELCVVTPKPGSSFSHKLNRMLSSLDLKIVDSCASAPYKLEIYDTSLTRDNPAITTADQALIFNYTFSANLDLSDKQARSMISRRSLVATRAVILNSQQIYTSYNTSAIQGQLEQIILSQLYDQLTLSETKANFVKPPTTVTDHANQS